MGADEHALGELRQQVAELQARVAELLERDGRGGAPRTRPPVDVTPAAEDTDEAEAADVAHMTPKPNETVGVGEDAPGGTIARRIPLASLGGPDAHLAPLSHAAAMYLTRAMHKAKRAEGSTISEMYTGEGQAPLSVAGDAGLLAVVTAAQGVPPRVLVEVLPVLNSAPWPEFTVKASDGPEPKSRPVSDIASDLEPLASDQRLLILQTLRAAPRSASDLQQVLALAPGQMYHHLKPLAQAGFLRKDHEGRYAISGPGRRALLATELLLGVVRHDRFREASERAAEARGDTRFSIYAGERSSEAPLASRTEESATGADS